MLALHKQRLVKEVPSGTATTMRVTEIMRMSTKAKPFSDGVRTGTPRPSCTKKRIMRAVNRAAPQTEPILAINSARLLSFNWRGVFSESPRSAIRNEDEECDQLTRTSKHTHHDATIETLGSNSHNDVFADTFQNLATRNHKAVGVKHVRILAFRFGFLEELDDFVVGNLLDGIGFTSST